MADKIFPDGIIFKKPREGAPDFVKGSLSFKVDEAVAFLKEHQNKGWVNLDLKKSKAGKLYLELNTFNREPPEKELTSEKVNQIKDIKAAARKKQEEGQADISDIPW